MTTETARRPARKRESGRGYLILGCAIAAGTLALVVLGAVPATMPAFAALVAGAALGLWLFRIGSRRPWVSLLCLLGALAGCFALYAHTDVPGPAAAAWMGGFVAGTQLGTAWRISARNRQVTSPAR
ncbi:hypothetical protein [Arthrobacter sp. N1]|uniref:hypothetical protein n=1 Tax=Arthrobacter sp. N1 TaxID=619291 RepID=UPI003BAEBE29